MARIASHEKVDGIVKGKLVEIAASRPYRESGKEWGGEIVSGQTVMYSSKPNRKSKTASDIWVSIIECPQFVWTFRQNNPVVELKAMGSNDPKGTYLWAIHNPTNGGAVEFVGGNTSYIVKIRAVNGRWSPQLNDIQIAVNYTCGNKSANASKRIYVRIPFTTEELANRKAPMQDNLYSRNYWYAVYDQFGVRINMEGITIGEVIEYASGIPMGVIRTGDDATVNHGILYDTNQGHIFDAGIAFRDCVGGTWRAASWHNVYHQRMILGR